MARYFKTLFGIDPFTVSRTDLDHYRDEMDYTVVLIPSDSLEHERFKRVDLQVVKRLDWGYPPGNFTFSNTFGKPVQLALYDSAGWKSSYGYLGDIPGISALLMPGASFSVELPEGICQVVLFDKEGKVFHSEPVPDTADR
jgi:hypothetical protein